MRTPSGLRTRKARLTVAGLALLGVLAVPSAVAAAPSGVPSGIKPTIVLEHGA